MNNSFFVLLGLGVAAYFLMKKSGPVTGGTCPGSPGCPGYVAPDSVGCPAGWWNGTQCLNPTTGLPYETNFGVTVDLGPPQMCTPGTPGCNIQGPPLCTIGTPGCNIQGPVAGLGWV